MNLRKNNLEGVKNWDGQTTENQTKKKEALFCHSIFPIAHKCGKKYPLIYAYSMLDIDITAIYSLIVYF